jgi:cytochrome c peroxidase
MAPNVPCFLPRAAAYDAMSNTLFVVCQGTNRLIGIPTPAGNASAWNVGKEPTGLALDNETRSALVWSQFSRTISQVPMEGMPDVEIKTALLGGPVDALDPVRVGRELFYRAGDARISADGRACGSCHPDGRDDGLVWSTPDGPRQTPTLAGRLAGTAPYGWNGSRNTVFKHVTSTLQRLGGTGLDAESMDAVVAYCMAMKPPARVDHEDPSLVAQGHALFESSATGCSSCHIEDGTFTDGNRRNVKSRAPGDPRSKFDTPSLRFVGGTGPYFHDGRFNSLRSLLLSNGGDDPNDVRMGHSAQLSESETAALEAYLRTL